jgi:hypothetical protein
VQAPPYLSGGFGAWEFVFTPLVTVCAYKGLYSYRLIGNPIIPFLPASSIGCAVCHIVIALWCFAGAPALDELMGRLSARIAANSV